MPWTDRDILERLDALQTRYVRALDLRDMAAWVGCFGPDSAYECIARENVDQDLPLALMMDDSFARIQDRANYVTKVWAGTFEDYTTRHFVQRLSWRRIEPALYETESNFMVAYTSAQRDSRILVAGLYVDRIGLVDGEPFFLGKRAVLDTEVTPRYLVYPV
jgi:3-phenylpropionate/cinnamic acid dioxygenase small subunit